MCCKPYLLLYALRRSTAVGKIEEASDKPKESFEAINKKYYNEQRTVSNTKN